MEPPVSLYADMLEVIALNYGYFKTMPAPDEVKRLLDEGARVERGTQDPLSHARLVMERAMLVPPFDHDALEAAATAVTASDDIRAAGVAARSAADRSTRRRC
jgi:hypothetical protein